MLLVPAGGNNFGLINPSYGTTRPSNTGFGITVAPLAGSYGAYVQLFAALSEPAYGILVNINSNTGSAASRSTVIDIGIDEAGGSSYTARVTGILCGGAAAMSAGGLWYYFPLFVPAGASIGIRANGSVTTAIRVFASLMQRPARPEMVRVGSLVDTLGVSGSVGTVIVPGTTSDGSWTLIGTTTHRCWSWQVGLQVAVADTAWTAGNLFVGLAVGDGTNFDIIIKDQLFITTTTEAISNYLPLNFERDVPAGSNIYMRAQSSSALDAYTAAAYGLGG